MSPRGVTETQVLPGDPMRDRLGGDIRVGRHGRLEERKGRRIGDEDGRVIRRQAEGIAIPRTPRRRQLRQPPAELGKPGRIDVQRRQVGSGK